MKRQILPVTLLGLAAIAVVAVNHAGASCYEDVSTAEVAGMLSGSGGEDPLVLDVRTAGEFNGPDGHIEGAVLVPVGELRERLGELEGHRDRDVVVICRSGSRSAAASKILCEQGFGKVHNLRGGMSAWRARGHPVER